jgi:hypothetical protein
MDMEDVILVATVREEIRDGTLRVDVADIPRRVEAAQAGKLNRPVGDKIYRGKQKRETAAQGSLLTTASGFNPNVEMEDATTMEASPVGPQHRDTTEEDTDESEVERSVSLLYVCRSP